jgi:hypothetical protein
MHISNVVNSSVLDHNTEMDLSFLQGFMQHIALGSASVLAILLITWLGMPRRMPLKIKRRATR